MRITTGRYRARGGSPNLGRGCGDSEKGRAQRTCLRQPLECGEGEGPGGGSGSSLSGRAESRRGVCVGGEKGQRRTPCQCPEFEFPAGHPHGDLVTPSEPLFNALFKDSE